MLQTLDSSKLLRLLYCMGKQIILGQKSVMKAMMEMGLAFSRPHYKWSCL